MRIILHYVQYWTSNTTFLFNEQYAQVINFDRSRPNCREISISFLSLCYLRNLPNLDISGVWNPVTARVPRKAKERKLSNRHRVAITGDWRKNASTRAQSDDTGHCSTSAELDYIDGRGSDPPRWIVDILCIGGQYDHQLLSFQRPAREAYRDAISFVCSSRVEQMVGCISEGVL